VYGQDKIIVSTIFIGHEIDQKITICVKIKPRRRAALVKCSRLLWVARHTVWEPLVYRIGVYKTSILFL